MFAFLTMVSHYMGMINVKSRLKNQIYTAVAFVGNWYLLYIAFRFLQNGRYLRGLGLLAIFIVFLYFTVMNIYYFFTAKQAPFDVSPKIEKLIGKPEELAEQEELKRRLSRVERQSQTNTGSNGVFNDEVLLPARISSTPTQLRNINQIAEKMKQEGLLLSDYGGQTDDQLIAQMDDDSTEFYAIGEGINFPYFILKMESGHPLVYAGMNQMDSLPIGEVTRVGLSDYKSAKREYHLYLADAALIGGERKVKGRSGLFTENSAYKGKIQMAYKRRQTSLPEDLK